MDRYIIEVFDIKNILKPKKLDEFILENIDGKSEAIDRGLSEAERRFPNNKRMIETRKVG